MFYQRVRYENRPAYAWDSPIEQTVMAWISTDYEQKYAFVVKFLGTVDGVADAEVVIYQPDNEKNILVEVWRGSALTGIPIYDLVPQCPPPPPPTPPFEIHYYVPGYYIPGYYI